VGRVDFPAQCVAADTITCPSLLMNAQNDRLVQPSIGEQLAALLHRSSVTHRVFDDGGHYLQRHQTAVIAAWLSTHGGPS
jgi:pimeloyl-ACP methyl ester carboxylesterase